MPMLIVYAAIVGVLSGYGAVLFTHLIHLITSASIGTFLRLSIEQPWWRYALGPVPAIGLLIVAWMTRRFAPEAQGHGVPEVILAVARKDGVIRPRVSIVKILASGLCIGTGGSVGREGPIVQIGSSLGSSLGQWLRLPPRYIKVLVACGSAAGISATFNAPLAGVIFASEIILGNFAVQNLTPIVIASVLADVIQLHFGEHGLSPAFKQLNYQYVGNLGLLPQFFLLGILCGVAAVSFTKLLYACESLAQRWIPKWWLRALIAGGTVGLVGVLYPYAPAELSPAEQRRLKENGPPPPPIFGVGYEFVEHALHHESENKPSSIPKELAGTAGDRKVRLNRDEMIAQLYWLLPLILIKPLMTSITLAGGGSGGIFSPSLFLGAMVGVCFGLAANLLVPEVSDHPGIYAIVGMGAVVAGTTHGPISSIIIVYEMTGDYRIILPIMTASVLSSMLAALIDPESIYEKKLSRRGESVARSHQMSELENIMVRDIMIRDFPSVKSSDTLTDIVNIARQNPRFETIPVMDDGELRGIIRPEDLHRLLDSDIPPHLIRAEDVALYVPVAVSPDENLLEALRDFGSRDVDLLPVAEGRGKTRKVIGMLSRTDVMQRYRDELLRAHNGF